MATRSAIFIQNETGEWICHYCHHDGYPEHMMPALRASDPAAILAAQELRGIGAFGTVDGFDNPRAPERQENPEWPEWAQHAYILTEGGWKHAKDSDQLLEATGEISSAPVDSLTAEWIKRAKDFADQAEQAADFAAENEQNEFGSHQSCVAARRAMAHAAAAQDAVRPAWRQETAPHAARAWRAAARAAEHAARASENEARAIAAE